MKHAAHLAALVAVVAASAASHAGELSYGAFRGDKWSGRFMPGVGTTADKASDVAFSRCKSAGIGNCLMIASCNKPGWFGVGSVNVGLPYWFGTVCGVADKANAEKMLTNACRERAKGTQKGCVEVKLQQLQ